MSDILSPRLLHLAMEAQQSFGKATNMQTPEAIKGMFCVHDMLDILGKSFDAKQAMTKDKRIDPL